MMIKLSDYGMWRPETELNKISGHPNILSLPLFFHSMGKKIVSGDETLRTWDAESEAELIKFEENFGMGSFCLIFAGW